MKNKNLLHFFVLLVINSVLLINTVTYAADLRRPISNLSPAWLIHVDVWADADPKKIIEIVPEDIRPFVIFNLSLSVSETGPYGNPNYADRVSIVESWVRICAEYGVWCIIQPASGYLNNLPYTFEENGLYEHFYKSYPNFVGYNFAEQCWGFSAATEDERISLLVNLINLGAKYGGYVFVSGSQSINSPQTNAIALLKRSAEFRNTCRNNSKHFVTVEKYTTSRGFYDQESTCLGAFLTEYAGNYGIRFDDCGWGYYLPRAYSSHQFPKTLGVIPIIEHGILTGQTVTDGPELTWTDMAISNGGHKTVDGYRSKSFYLTQNFINNNLDVFRRFIDGSFRIPDRQEVASNTKIAFNNDATMGSNLDKFSSQKELFTGLYAMDGEYSDNNMWTKKTGRYPTVPTIYYKQGEAPNTGGIDRIVNKSQYWSTQQSKINEFNTLFPQEYTGDIYARRNKNTWVTYNPYMHDLLGRTWNQMMKESEYQFIRDAGTQSQYPDHYVKVKSTTATGNIPFKYNTCERMEISHSNYGIGVIKEFPQKLEVYLNNFTDKVSAGVDKQRDNTIKIYGSTVKPTYSYNNKGGAGSGEVVVTDSWSNGVFTLTVNHNGPVEVTIHCSGSYTNGKLNDIPANPAMLTPAAPPAYNGPRQHEFEDFEYKNIASSKRTNIQGYTAMGFSEFGSNASAAMRKSISLVNAGNYILKIRYSAPNSARDINLSINGGANTIVSLPKTNSASDWNTVDKVVALNSGINTIEFKAISGQTSTLYLDNIVILSETESTDEIWLEAECGDLGSLWQVPQSASASKGQYIRVKSGYNSLDEAPTSTEGHAVYTFNINEAGTYDLWARVRTPSPDDDSFWIKMNQGIWKNWNNIPGSASEWTWVLCQSYTLSVGEHTLTVAYREDGTDMDKIYIGPNIPADYGGDAPACDVITRVTIQEGEIGFCGVDGVIDDEHDGFTGIGFANTDNRLGAGIDWKLFFASSGTQTLVFRYASATTRSAKLILNGSTVISDISFPATGSWSSWSTVAVNVNTDSGLYDVRLEATGNEGLGNVDYLEVYGGTGTQCDSFSRNISISKDPLFVVSSDYYSITGQKQLNINKESLKGGVYIRVDKMSDGTHRATKIIQ